MKALLISIKPKWVVKILNKEKTIEVRKGTALYKATKKLIDENGYAEIYVYCSKDLKSEKEALTWLNQKALSKIKTITYLGNEILGKVIFKFRCYKVEEINSYPNNRVFPHYDTDEYQEGELFKLSCLSYVELNDYLNGNIGYAIHISNLEIFDKPKELGEFMPVKWDKCGVKDKNGLYQCNKCPYGFSEGYYCECRYKPLTKAPQSWCYVEV